jgi:Zn-dependent protease
VSDLNLQSTLLSLPGVIIALTVHEYAHAFAAWRLGDPTAREQGRVTLNPFKHIDPFGFLLLVVAGFGWAKPVYLNKARLMRPNRDELIIVAAGPLANLALALLASVALRLIILVFSYSSDGPYAVFLDMAFRLVYINYGLFVFNMIPIPPLDGSHILFNLLRLSVETKAVLNKYGTLVLFAVIIVDSFTELPLLPIVDIIRAIASAVFKLLRF